MSLSYDNFKTFILGDESNNLDLYDLTEELQFSSFELKKVQRLAMKFKNVKIFNLAKNKLSSLPKEISKMKSLNSLILTANEFELLPDEICELKNLKTLIVLSNKLKSLPQNIGNLKKLETLWISKNEIETLPESFFSLTSLKDFRASNNKIITLGDFSNLINLEKLYLDHNCLEEIPNGLNKLNKLQKIDISYNKTKLSQFSQQNEEKINDLFDLDSIEFFKNDFNVENKFCNQCKKETNTCPPCGHYICPVCANKKMLQSFNDDYETTCPTCDEKFKTNELKEDDNKYIINIDKSTDQKLYCTEIGKWNGKGLDNCLCGKC